LEEHLTTAGEHVPYARIAVRAGGARILYLENPASQGREASPFIDSDTVVAQLVGEGHRVTVASTSPVAGGRYGKSCSRDIEYVDATIAAHYVFRELLSLYDVVWINGQQSMRSFLLHIREMDDRIPPILYQPGAVTSGREVTESRLGDSVIGISGDAILLCDAAEVVFVKSEVDKQFLLDKGITMTRVLSAASLTDVVTEVMKNARQASRSK
jgi:hypothetical protein